MRVTTLPDGIYHITSVYNGAYVALLDNSDLSDVVTAIPRLQDGADRGIQVCVNRYVGFG